MSNLRFLAITVAAIIGLAVVLAYFAGAFHDKVADTVPAQLAVTGTRYTANLEAVPLISTIPGTITPTDETIVGSRLLASVNEVHVRAGDRVEKGALLIEFDDIALRAIAEQREQAASSAQAALDESTLTRERAQQVFDAGSLSRSDYDRALTGHRIAEAELQRANQAAKEAVAQLGYARVNAPIGGTIQERYIEPGDTAIPGQPLLKLFNPGRLRVEAVLPERLIAFVAPGDELTARVDALKRTATSIVEEIVPSADPGSRTFRIKALLPAMPDVYPGMFARLDVQLGTDDRLLVPLEALRFSGQLTFAHILTQGTARARIVRTGARHDTKIEIISGIQPGDVLLIE